MTTQTTTRCALGIDGATLSAWHDGALEPSHEATLRAHVPTCPACQARMAEFTVIARRLRTRDYDEDRLTPWRQERQWRDLRERIAQGKSRTLMQTTRRTLWRGTIAVASIAVIITFIFVYARALHGFHDFATTTSAQGTPLSATQVWPRSALRSIAVKSGNFVLSDFAPDGSFVVGGGPSTTAQTNSTMPIFQIETNGGDIHEIATRANTYPLTDGHYIAWELNTVDEGKATTQIAYIELINQGTKYISLPEHMTGSLISLHQSELLWQASLDQSPSAIVNMTDLDSGKTTQLLATSGNPTLVTWPWISYNAAPNTGAQVLHMLNVETKQDVALPRTLAVPFAVSGNTVYGSYSMLDAGKVVTIIQEASPVGSTWHDSFRTKEDAFTNDVMCLGLTDRYFFIGAASYSTTQGGANQIIALDRLNGNSIVVDTINYATFATGPYGLGIFIHSNLLAYSTQAGNDSDTITLHFLDLSKLPGR